MTKRMKQVTNRELDIEVAKHVFGHKVVGLAWCMRPEGDWVVGEVCPPGTVIGQLENGSWLNSAEPVYLEWCKEEPCGRKGYEFVSEIGEHTTSCCAVVPEYCSSIEASWLVIEKMIELGWSYEVGNHTGSKVTDHYALFIKDSQWLSEDGESVQKAICLAALEAMKVK